MTQDAFPATLLARLRTLATTAAAITVGALNTIAAGGKPQPGGLQPGDFAPDFTLPASDGRVYRLSELVNKRPVVIAWFPKAFTGGCTAECESIGESSHALRRFDVAYFGASVDRLETNRRFAASMGIDFPILSDPDKHVARAYGVLGPSGFPSRWTFYVGLDGRVLAIDKHVRTATHGVDIAAAFAKLEFPKQT